MVPLRLSKALIMSFLTLIDTFAIGDVEFTQKPKDINLQTHSEKNNSFRKNHRDQQNHTFQPSQITRNSIQNQKLLEVGYQRPFWIWDFTALSHYEINATILAIGKYCYIFMENRCVSN